MTPTTQEWPGGIKSIWWKSTASPDSIRGKSCLSSSTSSAESTGSARSWASLQRRRTPHHLQPGGSDHPRLERCRRRRPSSPLPWLDAGRDQPHLPRPSPPGVQNRRQNELTRLCATLDAAGVGFYPSVDFTVVHRDRPTDGFVSFLHRAPLSQPQPGVCQHAQSGDPAAGSGPPPSSRFAPGVRPDGRRLHPRFLPARIGGSPRWAIWATARQRLSSRPQ